MGVTGLLRLLQPYSKQRSPSEFAGRTLGVDGYSWLHRAAASCAEDLLNGVPTSRLVQSIDNRVRVYEQNGVKLFFVFDGCSFKMKERVEKQRKRVREAARAQSSTSSASSASPSSSFSSALRGVDITADHAAMVIAYLKARGIRFVVAPYEADAQLVYLENEGIIDGIISEDSDLLVFGAQTLLTKCDSRTGSCIEVSGSRLPSPLNNLRSLRALAIISGCDYSPGINGLGPVKTKALVQSFGGNLSAIVEHLIASDRTDSAFRDLASQADLAFQFQRVWNPAKCCLVHLNVPAKDLLNRLSDAVVGTELSRAVAHRIALGIIDPSDQKTVLRVDPVVTQFVQRMRPYALPNPGQYATPQSVSQVVNRKLSASPFSSVPSTAAPPSVSRFFKPVKELTPKQINVALPSPASTTVKIESEEKPKAFSTIPSELLSGSPASKRLVSSQAPVPKLMRTDTIADLPSPSPKDRLSMIRQFAFTPQ